MAASVGRGESDSVEDVEVTWPAGQVDRVDGSAADQVLTLSR